MSLHPVVARITDRIRARSADARGAYLDRMGKAVSNGPVRAHLSCGNQAHAYAAMGADKDALVAAKVPNLGIITAYHYDYNHDSARNRDFVKAYHDAYGRNPNIYSIGGWDGMHLIYEALTKTGGKTDGDSLVAAAKGMRWESPRGRARRRREPR